jgi:hypothetical protein
VINVDTLYSRIEDLAHKDKAGYLSPTEFNRHLIECQTLLYEYYFAQYEKHQVIPEALRTFVAQETVALTSEGRLALPADYEHALRVEYRRVTNVAGGEPTIALVGAVPIHQSELTLTLSSPVRQPSLTKGLIYYHIGGDELWLYPTSLTGSCQVTYLRTPVTPFRDTTLDSTNDIYNYDSSGSTQLEWDASEQPAFVDLLLYHYGLPVKDSAIIQWVAGKKGVGENIATV